MYDIIIIGAGTAGLTAGIYAKQANKKVLILGFGKEGRSTYHFIKNNNSYSKLLSYYFFQILRSKK